MNDIIRAPKTSWRQILWSLLITIIIVPVAFWDVSLQQVMNILQRADWRVVVLATTLYVLTSLAKAARWEVFFQPRRLRFISLFAALIVGQTLNFLLPVRLGDIARIYILRRREREGAARALGTVAAEKLVELAMLLLLTFAVAWFLPLPQWLFDPSLRLSAIMLGAVLCLAVLLVQPARARRLWSWLLVRVVRSQRDEVERQLDLTLEGFTPLHRRVLLAKIVLWSVAIWWLMCATNYALFYALPIPASWLTATVLLIVLQVGVAVPSTPGRLGVFQFLANLTLGLFGIEREPALAYGVLLYLVTFVPQVLMAAPFVWQEVLSLRNAPGNALESVPRSS